MAPNTLVNFRMVKSMATDSILGVMALVLKVSGKIMNSKDTENTHGATEDYILAYGRVVECMVQESFIIPMDGCLKANLSMIRNTVKAH